MQQAIGEARDIGGYGGRPGYRVAVAGAASGIGRAAVARFVAMGCDVLAVDRDAAGLASLKGSVPGCTPREVDLLDGAATREALGASAGRNSQQDALINCVGITGTTNVPADQVDVEGFDRVVALNLRAAFTLSQAVLPGMLERNYGRILHVASIAGKEGNPGMTAYSASKAGLIGMVKSMGKDYATRGVTVNALAPAVIQTPLVDALPRATVDYMTQKIPMQRCGTLHEAAALIAWIVSPACSFCTGFTFDLSGGRATY
jgi:NAD(P)-dependent dehydrogenase (short-subunit alcohol dehydrogenase family)